MTVANVLKGAFSASHALKAPTRRPDHHPKEVASRHGAWRAQPLQGHVV